MSGRLVPSFETKRSLIDDQIRSHTRQARTWLNSDTGSRWYASFVKLNPGDEPKIEHVVVATENSLLYANRLRYQNGEWFFQGPMTHWQVTADGSDDISSPQRLEAQGELALGCSPDEPRSAAHLPQCPE